MTTCHTATQNNPSFISLLAQHNVFQKRSVYKCLQSPFSELKYSTIISILTFGVRLP